MQLPIYNAILLNDESGIFAISLVDAPATDVVMATFSEDNQNELKFAIQNEDMHLICAPVMLCDTPIFRNDNGKQYYVKYSAEVLRAMAEKMLADNTFNNIDLQHDFKYLEKGKISLVELYIKDEERGINPNFLDIPNYSLCATYKVNDEELWKMCKDGTFKGISLEGLFGLEITKEQKNTKNYMSKIMDLFKKALMHFGKTATDKAELIYDGEELIEGTEVFIETTDADGNTDYVAPADGEYTAEDGKVITIKDGKVESIKEAEKPAEEEKPIEEEMSTEETETPATDPADKTEIDDENPMDERVAALETKLTEVSGSIEGLLNTIAGLETKIAELEGKLASVDATPATTPAEDTPIVEENKKSRMSYLRKNV